MNHNISNIIYKPVHYLEDQPINEPIDNYLPKSSSKKSRKSLSKRLSKSLSKRLSKSSSKR